MPLHLALQVYHNNQPRGVFQFASGSQAIVKIGRGTSSTVQLQDPAVARVHAVIELGGEKATLIDLGSAQGTLVNGQKVNRTPLNTGDQIAMGQTVLHVFLHAGEQPMSAPPSTPPVVSAPQQPHTADFPTALQTAAAMSASPQSAIAAQEAHISPQLRAVVEKITQLPEHTLPELDRLVDRLLLHGSDGGFGAADSDYSSSHRATDFSSGNTDFLSERLNDHRKHSQRKTAILAAAGAVLLVAATWLVATAESTVARAPQTETSEGDEALAQANTKTMYDANEAQDEEAYVYFTVTSPQAVQSIVEQHYFKPELHMELLLAANPKVDSIDQRLTVDAVLRLPRYATHTIQPGETLGVVAKDMLGDARLYEAIYKVNTHTLPDPSAVEVGMTLQIPVMKPPTAPVAQGQ